MASNDSITSDDKYESKRDGTSVNISVMSAGAVTVHSEENPPVTKKQWLLVLSSFFVFMNTWGLLLTFGTFQTYYQQELLPHKSASDISWISTICAFILLFSGVVTGTLFDYGYLRPLLFIGSLLEVFGLMMVSISTKYYHLVLAQGMCVGLGAGMLYIPSVAATAAALQPFRRAKFMGLISTGSGIGGVIYPIMFQRLLSSLGFAWAIRIIAFLIFSTFLMSYPILIYKPRKSPLVRPFIDADAFSDTPFLLIILGGFLCAIAYFVPMFYIPLYAETEISGFRGHHVELTFYLVSIVNGASVIGRLIAGVLGTLTGPTETTALAVGASSIVIFLWILVKSVGGMIVWATVWGIVSSVIVTLPGAMVPLFSPSIEVIGTRVGMFWAGVGVGVLIGSPIAGAMVDLQPGDIQWWRLQVFSGVLMAAGALCFVYPVLYVRKKTQNFI
ncbi:MFS monocarboxylate transporter, putative [Talaromyces stipitatus ATCC 10500]|uniref:MFS monocarboxylate transporter, putative n=1 Tax=Talaromyces stipitatus (strain ATCC 10500 / CBS 375.48 / QM 6759 / NRRL 1006) TaxID=441959 RepID=B8M0S1_TALSN|nr:MFS monocarboxylate transporter, putative [Talaromyces stipitatus ATCC 10500]EED21454.1 MFS monocarboxylate transporter, putative [Talaromyces stipitatus ATCC 10500]